MRSFLVWCVFCQNRVYSRFALAEQANFLKGVIFEVVNAVFEVDAVNLNIRWMTDLEICVDGLVSGRSQGEGRVPPRRPVGVLKSPTGAFIALIRCANANFYAALLYTARNFRYNEG